MAGSGKGKGKGPAVATGAIMGGFLLLGLIMTGIAATIVLSLISIYTSNNSKQGNGDYFRIRTYGLKTLTPAGNNTFANSSVAENTFLSSLCSTMYAKSSTARNLAGCVATGFTASTVNNSNTSRRRRQAESGIALVGEIRIYYSTTCGQSGEVGRASNSSGLSSCVSARLAECNALFNSNGTLTQWTPIPNGMTFNIVSSNSSTFVSVSPARIFALSQSQTADYVNKVFGNSTARSMALEGCIYGGPISLEAIAAALSAQSSATTTQPSSTAASG